MKKYLWKILILLYIEAINEKNYSYKHISIDYIIKFKYSIKKLHLKLIFLNFKRRKEFGLFDTILVKYKIRLRDYYSVFYINTLLHDKIN